MAFEAALVCDRGGRWAAVADLEVEALADGLAMGVRCCDCDGVVAEVAVRRCSRDDAGVGIDAEAGRQLGREGQGITGGGSLEVARDIQREGMALKGALICDGGSGRAAVADGKVEALADRLAMGIGRGDRDSVVAEVAVGRRARDDSGMGIDAEAGRQLGREGQCIASRWRSEVAGDIEREAWPSKALWFAMAVAVGPLSPTARWKLSLMALPWASVAVTVTVLSP